MNYLKQRKVHLFAVKSSRLAYVRVALFRLEKGNRLIVFHEGKINLPFFLIPDVKNFKVPQSDLCEPHCHPEKIHRKKVLKSQSAIENQWPLEEIQLFLFYD